MKKILMVAILLGSTAAFADSTRNAYELQLIMNKIGAGGDFFGSAKSIDSIVRRGESYNIRFTDKNGECAEVNAMVLGKMTGTEFSETAVVDEVPRSCQ